MDGDVVPAAVGGRDLRHRAVDRAGVGAARADRDNGSLAGRVGRVGLADLDVMRPAVDPVDDQVVAVVELVRQAPRHHPTDEPARVCVRWVIDPVVDRGARQPLARERAMQCLDDVAALAHAAEHRLEVVGELPATGRDLLGEAEATQLLQPARPKRLSEGVAIRSGPDASRLLGLAQEAAVDAGEAFLLDLGPQPNSISRSVRGPRSRLTISAARSRMPWLRYSRAMIRSLPRSSRPRSTT